LDIAQEIFRMNITRLLEALLLCASLCLQAGCEVATSTSPSASTSGNGSTAKGATLVAKLPPAAVLAGRAHFKATSLAGDHLAGSLRIDKEVISFEAAVETGGDVRAAVSDTEGTVLLATIKADGRRALRYNGHRIAVSPDGVVSPDAFSGLSRAMRVALGLVPLNLACEHASGDGRMMEALALPFNLLQRAEPGVVGPRDLLPAATCARASANRTPEFSTSELLSRAKLIVSEPTAAPTATPNAIAVGRGT
jgi:hypothetical protein